jgi:RNA polymerase sigma factor (sigma-70 family)
LGPEDTLPHIPRLRRYARLLTGDAVRADDLVQDTLERACRKWSLWRPNPSGGGLRSWLLSIMHNLFINHLRDNAHMRNDVELDDGNEPAHQPVLHTHTRLDLEAALAELPAPLREVILLVCVEELTYAEAAQVLGTPVGTVMSRLSRARERLRGLMEDPASGSPAQQPPRLKVVK